MMHYDNPAEVSAARAAASLQRGEQICSDVPARPEHDVSAAGSVYLRQGDEQCSDCEQVIGEFGNAPYIPVLARIKRRYGTTLCQECHLARGRGE
jgi:hypothetical protein